MKIIYPTRKEWNEIIKNSSDAWLFHLYDWKKIIEETWQYKSVYIGIKENERLICVFPLFILERFGFKFGESIPNHIASPAFDVVSDKKKKKIYTFLIEYIEKKININWLKIYVHPLSEVGLSSQVNPLVFYGFQDFSSYIYLINLEKNKEELWFEMNKKSRNLIRKAQKNNIRIIKAEDKEDVEEFYHLHIKTFKNTKAIPYPKKYFKLTWKYFKEYWNIFLAKYNNETIAGVIIPIYKKGASYWMGVSDRKYLSLGVNNLLLWHAILYAKEKSCKYFDTSEVFPNATNEKLRGIHHFKKNFGGELRYLYKGIKIFSLKKWYLYNTLRVIKKRDLNALRI